MTHPDTRAFVYLLIDGARHHQNEKFPADAPDSFLPKGDEHNADKLAILVEEVGEVARALNEARHTGALDRANLHHELIQLAACAVSWVEHDLERESDG